MAIARKAKKKVTKKKVTKKRSTGDVMRVVQAGGRVRTIHGKENQKAFLDKRESDGACEAQDLIAKANQLLLKASFALQPLIMSDLPTRFEYDDLSMEIADFRFGLSEQVFDVLEKRCNSLSPRRSKKRAKVRRRT
jgi:hypothetical protein